MIEAHYDGKNTKIKKYSVNTLHPLFTPLRTIILQYVGLDQIIEQIIQKLGNVEKVFLNGDLALGKNSSFIDLVIIGDIDKPYLHKLIEKVEPLIAKKIRVGVFSSDEFIEKYVSDLGVMISLLDN